MGPLAIAGVGMGINALFNLLGARKQASAAEKASQLQAQSTNRAMGMMQQAYAPYLNAGAQSMGVLSRLMTPGVPYSPEMQQADAMGGQSFPMLPPAQSAFQLAMTRRGR